MVRALYRCALRFYPADYRARFGAEMLAVFDAAYECDRRRRFALSVREVVGLAAGIVREWRAKLAADPATRGRRLPDCRRMRPAGVTRAEWAAGLEGFDALINEGRRRGR